MEKIVTKIGNVTIERKVSRTPVQKFSSDRHPQNITKSQLDDLVKTYSQNEGVKEERSNPESQYGLGTNNTMANTILGQNMHMGKNLNLRSETEHKISLPKGITWEPSVPTTPGNWSQFHHKTGVKNYTKYSDQLDLSKYAGISIERKRARTPSNESSEKRLGGRSLAEKLEPKRICSTRSFKTDLQNFSPSSRTVSTKDEPYRRTTGYEEPDVTVEKKGNSGMDLRQYIANSYGNMASSVERFRGSESKSPIHLSSDDEKPSAEYSDLKEEFEESLDNESEDEEIQKPIQGKRSENDQETGIYENDMILTHNEKGSPIVLSSEDEDRNDEDVVEVTQESKGLNRKASSKNYRDNMLSDPIVLDDSISDSSAKGLLSKTVNCDTSEIKPMQRNSSSLQNELPNKVIDKKRTSFSTETASHKSSEFNHSGVKTELDTKEAKVKEELPVKTETNCSEEISDTNVEVKNENLSETIEEEKYKKKENETKIEPDDDEIGLKSSETELPNSDGSVEGDEKETKTDEDSKEDISDIVCDDLMELMKKGEIEGEVEDDKEFESEEDGNGKKKGKRKLEKSEGDEKDELKTKNKKKKSEKTDEAEKKEEDDKNIDKTKVTSANLRKNIREVMDETKLDEATLSAQRQEAERLKRLQEQQRIIRELQKQIVLNRQNQKSQGRFLSLLQGNSQTSILKTNSSAPQTLSQSKSPNHVLVKLSNGQQTSLNNKNVMELLKKPKNKLALTKPMIPKALLKQGMVSPSVSIAPITKKEPPVDDKKKKKGDIVTLSSDSEDDCIVLSEEDESEPEEDPTNSGMHTSDKYNVPDEQGRVIVNVGHPESESDIFLAPQIARVIKPHQIGGIRFLYDNVIESLERFQNSTGFGCILAHSMGLGKTLQIVSFSDIFLRYTSAKTILCIMPINTIQNWFAEFNMWLPKESSSTLEVRCREFDLYIVNESLKNINARSKVIMDWHKNGGVLLMGYELFRLLSLKKSCKSKKKKKETEEKEDEAKNKELIEEVYTALVRPGPDLVICDEGHRIKNSHATTSQALKQIRTKRRIVLTGYPLQNNLLEYWCMVDFVRPNYLGSKTEFSNMFERPIQNGQCIDSTPQDKRLMRYRAHVLHSLLEGFVQRRSHAVLQSTLPEKEEYVLLLRFTPFQRKLYDTFMNEVVRTVAVPNPLKAFAVCCKIWNHPDVLYHFLKKKGEEIDLDLEEALPSSLQASNYPFGQNAQDGMDQFTPSPMVPPWPRRGPGSRGGKVRQPPANRRVGRGRKPAATVSPNLMAGYEKKEHEGEGFGSSCYPTNYPDFQHQNSVEPLLEGDRGNRNFDSRGFNQYSSSEYRNHSNFPGSGYDNKNPLENLEDLSSGDFQGKRFYPQHGERGMSSNFSSLSCMQQQNSNYSPNVNSDPNDSMNKKNSRFNPNETSKAFQYHQDFNSEFYPGAPYQGQPQSNADFDHNNKANFNRNNASADSGPYYQGSRFAESREGNNATYNMKSTNNDMDSNYQSYGNRNADQNFHQGNLNRHYPNSETKSSFNDTSNTTLNYQGQVIETQRNPYQGDVQNRNNYTEAASSRSNDSNYQKNDFQGTVSNFSNNSLNLDHNNLEGAGSSNNFQSGNRPGYTQDYWPGSNWPSCGFGGNKTGGDKSKEFLQGDKYNTYDGGNDGDTKKFQCDSAEKKSFGIRVKMEHELDERFGRFDEDKNGNKMKEESLPRKKEDEFKVEKKEEFKTPEASVKKDDNLPYDWATDLFKNYVTGIIENSSKMEVFFHILTETINLGDRLLVFSQSLLTLDLIEDYLHRINVPNREEKWAKNRNYFRLDGSTPGLEREKLINEFNSNPNVFIFLVSTRAGSLGINLVGANRVVVFDASWNPCHDTQAVCRVYRYGQQKPCFVYRLVMDSCLEKKIYDRQINKQGMADRVVDELNPDAHLSIKEVTNLCWDDQEDTNIKDFSYLKDKYNDQIIKVLLENCSKLLSKEPFQHESLLIDRKEKKLSQAEKRLAKRSYELEKQAANQPKNIYSFFPNAGGSRNFVKPIASVRPMQNEMASRVPPVPTRSKWIPAEVWQKQGMSAQEMTLPLDVVIPTNAPDKTSIILKAGQRVMVLKSSKGIYMQLENGKIIAIRTAFKVGQGGPGTNQSKADDSKKDAAAVATSLKNNPNVTITSKLSNSKFGAKPPFPRGTDKKLPINITSAKPRPMLGKTKPLLLNRKFQSVTPEVRQRLMASKPNFEAQEDASSVIADDKNDVILTKDTNESGKFDSTPPAKAEISSNQKRIEEPQEQQNKEIIKPHETLRKVNNNMGEESKSESRTENSQAQVNIKNYRNNFSSQLKNKPQESDEEKEVKEVKEVESANLKTTEQTQVSLNGNENVQNWLMNQSYPHVDPYGNYFPNYYGYGHSTGSMVNPYEGFYPNNYSHSLGPNSNPSVKQDSQGDTSKVSLYPQNQPPPSPNIQQNENPSNRSSSSSMYNQYPNPYQNQYQLNYSNNPVYNNQGYPFTGQNQNQQQQQQQQHQSVTMNSNNANNSNASTNQTYDSSMYSAFHRPDSHFQGSESTYPTPYRSPCPNSTTSGFFSYNTPYRSYPDPNYHYGANFNPYMHPPSYGYPMQNPAQINSNNNNGAFHHHSTESATNSS